MSKESHNLVLGLACVFTCFARLLWWHLHPPGQEWDFHTHIKTSMHTVLVPDPNWQRDLSDMAQDR